MDKRKLEKYTLPELIILRKYLLEDRDWYLKGFAGLDTIDKEEVERQQADNIKAMKLLVDVNLEIKASLGNLKEKKG